MGIDEITKAIDAIENGGIQLLNVDWDKVHAEIDDLDWIENKEIAIRIMGVIANIIGSLNMTNQPVVSFVAPIASKIAKGLLSK